MQTIYYNKKTNHTVVDLSGKKGAKAIADEFGKGFDQVIKIDETKQSFNVIDGKLEAIALKPLIL